MTFLTRTGDWIRDLEGWRRLLLAFEVGAATESSLAATEKRQRADAKAKGEAAFRDEPFVRDLLVTFDGQVKTETITPLPRGAGN